MRDGLFILVALLLTTALTAAADLPDPCCSTSIDGTGRLLLIPDEDGTDPHPAASFWVIVRNGDCIPIQNAVVEVLIGGQADGKVRLCGSAVTVGTTDADGYVEFNIPGGGCYKGEAAGIIRANGVTIRHFYAVVSPDYAGSDNEGIAGYWSLSINPSDLAGFVLAYQGGVGPTSCHDYSNDGTVGPGDLATFVSAWSGGTRSCTP